MSIANFIYVIIVLVVCWLAYRNLRNHPEWFHRENMSKSFGVMGVLALFLIGLVAVCVLMLR